MLSRNFGWSETAVSTTHPDLAHPVPEDLKPNVERLARTVLQPIRDRLRRPMKIISWYRSPALNIAVGGSPSSQHTRGEACDFTCDRLREAWVTIIEMVREGKLDGAGQLIYYPDRQFIHVALPSARFPKPTLCVHWPQRKLSYRRHNATLAAFERLVPMPEIRTA